MKHEKCGKEMKIIAIQKTYYCEHCGVVRTVADEEVEKQPEPAKKGK